MSSLLKKKHIEPIEFGSYEHREYLQGLHVPTDELILPIGIPEQHDDELVPSLGIRDLNCCIVGKSGSGVSNTVLAIMGGMSLMYTAEDLQIMYADFRHGSCETLLTSENTVPPEAKLNPNLSLIPTVSTIRDCRRNEKQLNFLVDVQRTYEYRKKWLHDSNLRSFVPVKGLPRCVVVLDNILPLTNLSQEVWLLLHNLLNSCAHVGINFIASGTNVSNNHGDGRETLFCKHFQLNICHQAESSTSCVVQCSKASHMSSQYGLAVVSTDKVRSKQIVYQIPLVTQYSLYHAFATHSTYYECDVQVGDLDIVPIRHMSFKEKRL